MEVVGGPMSKELTPERARIFRITHAANLRWILQNGLHSANSAQQDPNFTPIGNPELIGKRRHHPLKAPHPGTLGDYVPFYFTPWSPMMLNIHTGHGGIPKQPNRDILVLVSSFERLQQGGAEFVFTDRHAYLGMAQFFDDPARLDQINWDILQRRDFKRDEDNPDKFAQYEAETLVRSPVPVEALLGVACFDAAALERINDDMAATGVDLRALVTPRFYFQ